MSQYPDIAVGDLVTADLLASMLPAFVRKAADEAAPTSSAAVQDDDELFLDVVANASYFVDAWLRHTAVSNTPDIRLNYSYPAGASFARSDWGAPDTTTTSADTINNTISTTTDNTRGSNTVERAIYMRGELIVGSTAGTFKVRFGQATSSVDAVTMKAGSRLILTRYA